MPTAQRPDLVIVDNSAKSIHIVELTVPLETNIQTAHERKMSKYQNLQSDIIQNGFKCYLNCLEIGSRGLVTTDNVERLRTAFRFAGAKLTKSLVKEISQLALISSYTIWNARNDPQWDAAPYLKI
jgi:hypothetical protein